MPRSSTKYVHRSRRSTIPERPREARGGKSSTMPARIHEAPTQPSMKGPESRKRPLHDTLPEMDIIAIKKGLGSDALIDREQACVHLKKMVEGSDGVKLAELAALAVKALEAEGEVGIVISLVDCLLSAMDRGHSPDDVLSGLIRSLGGKEKEDLRMSAIRRLGDMEDKSFVVPLIQLIGASSCPDDGFGARLRERFKGSQAGLLHKTTYSVPSVDGRYMLIRPAHSSMDVSSRSQASLPSHVASLDSESMARRLRAMVALHSYVSDADTAREVLSLLPAQKSKEAEKIRLHCIQKLKGEI